MVFGVEFGDTVPHPDWQSRDRERHSQNDRNGTGDRKTFRN